MEIDRALIEALSSIIPDGIITALVPINERLDRLQRLVERDANTHDDPDPECLSAPGEINSDDEMDHEPLKFGKKRSAPDSPRPKNQPLNTSNRFSSLSEDDEVQQKCPTNSDGLKTKPKRKKKRKNQKNCSNIDFDESNFSNPTNQAANSCLISQPKQKTRQPSSYTLDFLL